VTLVDNDAPPANLVQNLGGLAAGGGDGRQNLRMKSKTRMAILIPEWREIGERKWKFENEI
jgi:hypothetical protein